MFHNSVVALGALAVALSGPGSASAVVMYDLIVLGFPEGGGSVARDINASGQVVGYASHGIGGGSHAFLYSDGVMNDIGAAIGTTTYSQCINDCGQVAVYSYTGSSYLYADGTYTNLGRVSGSNDVKARGINNRGQVVGQAYVSAYGTDVPFLYSNDAMNNFLGVADVIASDINDAGQIVGGSGVSGTHTRAYVYGDGVFTDLSNCCGVGSFAQAISDNGQIVGMGWGRTRAFLYSDGIATDLGHLPGGVYSYALGISPNGDYVVGRSTTDDTAVGTPHAFLYSDGVMKDLNSLIDPSENFVLKEACAVNNNGWIIGNGTGIGRGGACLLIPVPEPSAIVLLGIGAFGLVGISWRRIRKRISTN